MKLRFRQDTKQHPMIEFDLPNTDEIWCLVKSMPINVFECPNSHIDSFPAHLDQTTKICPSRWQFCGSTLYLVYPSPDQVCSASYTNL